MVTLCLPTKNRPVFLARTLRYYAAMRFGDPILIGDSSDSESVQWNQQMVTALRERLTIRYHAFPGLSACACLEELSRIVTTPYCAFLGDDDFLCPRGLEECAVFLDTHPDYGAAHGQALVFQTDGNRPHGPLTHVSAYPQAVLEERSGAGRLRELLTVSRYAVLNSVHQTELWQAMFRGVSALSGVQNANMFKDELIEACISAIRGKVNALPILSLVRHVHVEDSYRFPHVYEWLTDPAWWPSYRVFHARLVEELCRVDGMTVAQAHEAIRQGFWPYLAHVVGAAWSKEQTDGAGRAPSRLRTWAKRIPGLRRGVQGLRAAIQRSRDPWSLPALLDPSSPYHADFLPVYQAVTAVPESLPAAAPAPIRSAQPAEVGCP